MGIAHPFPAQARSTKHAAAPPEGGNGGGGVPAVPDEPFLLVLGDHLYRAGARATLSCAQQLLAAHGEQPTKAAVAVALTDPRHAANFGVVSGAKEAPPMVDDTTRRLDVSAVTVTKFVEKPDAATAEALAVPGLAPPGAEATVLTVFGMYVLPPRVFDFLDDDVRANRRHRGVFSLTSALQRCADGDGLRGILVDGTRFDFGDATAFAHTWSHFSKDPS